MSAADPSRDRRKNKFFANWMTSELEIYKSGIILLIHNFVKNGNGYSGLGRRKENQDEKNVSAVEHQKSA